MATEIGQTSQTHPAAIQDSRGEWHLLFQSQDSSNRLLYATSLTGGLPWYADYPWADTRQTTSAAPAIALVQPNLLVAVFVANNPSRRILYSTLKLTPALDLRTWRFGGQVGSESAQSVYAVESGGAVIAFFLSADASDRLLMAQFTP